MQVFFEFGWMESGELSPMTHGPFLTWRLCHQLGRNGNVITVLISYVILHKATDVALLHKYNYTSGKIISMK